MKASTVDHTPISATVLHTSALPGSEHTSTSSWQLGFSAGGMAQIFCILIAAYTVLTLWHMIYGTFVMASAGAVFKNTIRVYRNLFNFS